MPRVRGRVQGEDLTEEVTLEQVFKDGMGISRSRRVRGIQVSGDYMNLAARSR